MRTVDDYDNIYADTFIAAFPTIEEVVLNTKCGDISLVLHRLESTREPLWPELRTLTIVDLGRTRCRLSESQAFLSNIIDFALARIASGRPVFHVKLSATLFGRVQDEHLKKLREGTSLEVLDDDD
jgi:hypothetical protein